MARDRAHEPSKATGTAASPCVIVIVLVVTKPTGNFCCVYSGFNTVSGDNRNFHFGVITLQEGLGRKFPSRPGPGAMQAPVRV